MDRNKQAISQQWLPFMSKNYLDLTFSLVKSKNTKILNSEENLKRKVPNQMANSKVQTHQRNG